MMALVAMLEMSTQKEVIATSMVTGNASKHKKCGDVDSSTVRVWCGAVLVAIVVIAMSCWAEVGAFGGVGGFEGCGGWREPI